MFVACLFGIALHERVYGGINFQSVGIYIIGLSVFLFVFVTPAIEWVVYPVDRVLYIFGHVPLWIVRLLRIFCHHISPQEVAEVSSNAVLMVSYVEVKVQGLGGVF